MPFVRIEHPLFPDGVEVDERLLQKGNEELLNNELIQLGGMMLPEDEEGGYGRDFIQGITSSARGIADLLGVEGLTEGLPKDIEMYQRMRSEGDNVAFGMRMAGELLDPVTAPAAVLKFLKGGNIITELMKRGAAAGGFSGVIQPVYEEFGDSRALNTGAGVVLGGGIGAALGTVARKLGYKSADEMAQAMAQMKAEEAARLEEAVRKEVDALQRIGDNNRQKVADNEAAAARQAEETARLEAEEVAARTDAEARAVEEHKAELAAKIDEVPDDAPDYRQLDKNIKSMENQVKFMEGDKRLADLNRRIERLRNSKLKEMPKKKALEPLLEERKRMTAIKDEAQKLLDQNIAERSRLQEANRAREELRAIEEGNYTPQLQQRIKVKGDEAVLKLNEVRNMPEPEAPKQAPQQAPLAQAVQQAQGTAAVPQRATSAPLRGAPVDPSRPIESSAPAAPVAPSATPAAPATPTTPAPYVPPTTAQKVGKAFDNALGNISTRLREKFAPVFQELRRFESKVQEDANRRIRESKPFFDAVGKLSPEMRSQLSGHLFSGDFDEAYKLMTPEMRKDFGVIRQELYKMHKELKAVGIDIPYIENYFPRRVKDLDGLRAYLGRQHQSEIDRVITEYRDKNDIKPSEQLDSQIEADLINKVVRNIQRKRMIKAGPTARRTVDKKFNDELLSFYEEPSESLTKYYQKMTEDYYKSKFFGKSGVKDTEGNIDLKDSIGNTLNDMRLQANGFSDAEERELLDILQARFIEGEKAMNIVFATGRDLGYVGTIANVISAVTNLGDIGTSAGLHGVRNTVKAMLGVGGDNKYNVVDMGIDHTIAHELRGNKATANFLNKMFKGSGFAALDRLGKDTVVNAAMRKNEKLAQTDAGKAKLRAKWGKAYGDEIESLITDLEKGNITDNTKLLAFHELSDVQPISLSEMPKWYLENPNGRILYMLKSFTLKQFDIVRREIVREYAKGNKGNAIAKATALVGYATAANLGTQVVKDMAQGREVRPEDLPSKAMWTLLGIYGFNNYIAERYLSQGDLGGALVNTILPPLPVLDSLQQGVKQTTKMIEDEDYNYFKATRAFPIFGPLVYSWMGGGAERYNDRLDD
jgi:hypothetical protein